MAGGFVFAFRLCLAWRVSIVTLLFLISSLLRELFLCGGAAGNKPSIFLVLSCVFVQVLDKHSQTANPGVMSYFLCICCSRVKWYLEAV